MKKLEKRIVRTSTLFITGIALATLFHTGFSFAKDEEREITSGSIRIQQEESVYPSLATITMEQAKDISQANIQGQILKIELENENGFLVYGVEVVTPEKTITEIKIDAGNGEILLVEKDDDDQERESYNDEEDDQQRDDRD